MPLQTLGGFGLVHTQGAVCSLHPTARLNLGTPPFRMFTEPLPVPDGCLDSVIALQHAAPKSTGVLVLAMLLMRSRYVVGR